MAAHDSDPEMQKTIDMTQPWQPHSWRSHDARQLPTYKDDAALAAAEKELSGYPPLVFAGEARDLTHELAKVAEGEGLPAAGRRLCRELCRVPPEQHPRHLSRDPSDGGRADLRVEAADGEARSHGRPVCQAAFGGYRDDRWRVELPSYRGDNVNDIAFTAEARIPDPQRMIKATPSRRRR
jgi:3-deoxy-7-phosphoheptulonate synthase